jgi:hypothetical protein
MEGKHFKIDWKPRKHVAGLCELRSPFADYCIIIRAIREIRGFHGFGEKTESDYDKVCLLWLSSLAGQHDG